MKPFRSLGLSLTTCAALLAQACGSSDAPASSGANPPGGTAGSSGGTAGGSGGSNSPSTTVVTMENFGAPHNGVDATFYTFADGSGACLYDKNSADVNIA